jgi:hypothetical protein
MENKQLINLTSKLAGTVALASVSSLAFAFNADAASLLFTDSDSFTNQLTELVGMPELTVTKYVPPAGTTITEVQVMVMATLNSSGTVTNNAPNTQTFTALTLVNQFNVIPSENPPTTLQPFPAFTTIGSQNYTLEAGASAPFGPFEIDGMQNQIFTSAGDIASLTGPGTIDFNPFTLIFTTFQGGGGNIGFSIDTFADAEVSIKYFGETITPPPSTPGTPEPSALVGLGILTGLGFIGRKKASKKS